MNGRNWRSRRRGPSMRLMGLVACAIAVSVLLLLYFTASSELSPGAVGRPEVALHWRESSLSSTSPLLAGGKSRLGVQLANAVKPSASSADLYLPSQQLLDVDEPLPEESTWKGEVHRQEDVENEAASVQAHWGGLERQAEEDSREEDMEGWGYGERFTIAQNGDLGPETEEEVEEGHLLLLHQGRCGSTVLMSLMRQPPNRKAIVWSSWNEFLTEIGSGRRYVGEDWDDEWLTRFVRGKTETAANGATKNLILSLKFAHVCRLGVPLHAALAALHKAGFRHMVVLHRSYLKVALSMAHVKQKNVAYHAGSAQVESCSELSLQVGGVADVPPGRGALQNSCGREDGDEPLLGSFEVLDKGYLDALQSPLFRDHLLLSYEKDIYEDPVVAYVKLRAYLSRRGINLVAPEELEQASLAKTTDCSVEEMMEPSDYAAVSGRLAETKWAWTLLREEELQAMPEFPASVIYPKAAPHQFY